MKKLSIPDFLSEVRNKFFSVSFTKADGSIRNAQACARLPPRMLKGGSRTTDPKKVVLFLDLQLAKQRKRSEHQGETLNAIRSFRWDRVRELHFNGKIVTTGDLELK